MQLSFGSTISCFARQASRFALLAFLFVSVALAQDWTSFSFADLGINPNEADRINDMAVDSSTAAWGATNGAGVLRFDPSEEVWYNYRELFGQLPGDNVKVVCVCVDDLGAIWLGTENGVGVFALDVEYTTFNTIDGLPDNRITALSADRNNHKWAGTLNGAAVYDGSDWTSFTYATTANGLVDNHIFAIAVDSSNGIWFGTGSGVSVFKNNVWSSYTTADGLADNQVYDILVTAQGVVWIATENGVSVHYPQSGQWHTINNPDTFGDNVFYDIKRDAYGNFWLASSLGGIKKYADTSWVTTYTTADGLLDNTVTALTIGGDNVRWIGSWGGINRFSNTAPVFTTAPQNFQINEKSPWQTTVVAADIDRDRLEYSLSGSPSGLTVGKYSGVLSWTPNNGDVGSSSALVVVSDATGGFDSLALTFTIINVNDRPVMTAFEPQEDTLNVGVNTVIAFTLEGTDEDGDAVGARWYVNGVLDTTTVLPALQWSSSATGQFTIIAALFDGTENGDSAVWVVNVAPPVGIASILPGSFGLAPPSPNPFKTATVVRYQVPQNAAGGLVELRVFDLNGKLVRNLVRAKLNAGFYEAVWDGCDARGELVAAGHYIVRIETGGVRLNRRVVVN